ncbi:YjbH domain-containing protein [Aliidiomarina indica]|uniref:YjbH domain-containing protein n=1 Tax=Aliidiomarina indica TaxID=2749147 RepID=UPI00188E87CF|nr:YjbH domain-containing protein [Aliidiomarina indica]
MSKLYSCALSLSFLVMGSFALLASTTASGQEQQESALSSTQHQITVELQAPLRLDAFLQFALEQFAAQDVRLSEPYWPNARLVFNDRAQQAEQARIQVLRDLDAIATYHPNIAALLKAQIENWHVGVQPYGEISLERARLSREHNPLLPAGSYTLYVPERNAAVHLYGFTESYGKQRFISGQTLRGYVAENSGLLAEASRDSVTVLRNSGSGVERARVRADVPWGPHNATSIELLPGDVVWLGPRDASAHGLIPLGTLGHGLSRDARKAAPNFAAHIEHLLEHFVYDDSGARVSVNQGAGAGRISRFSSHGGWQRDVMDTATGIHSDEHRRVTLSNYGQAGLIQMPTARMVDAGEITLSYNDMDIYRRYTVNLQVFDWLEASAFYVRVPSRLYSSVPGFSGDQMYTDKGFDVKIRLWEESYYLPEVAVGLRDFAGTGLFDGEFIAASKAWGPFDFTLGMGFGRMGTRDHFKNPFCNSSDSFCERPTTVSGRGGELEYDQWFRGSTALFGGVEYQTPWQPLRLKLEYDGNDYSDDFAIIENPPRTPWNVGLNYQLNNAIDLRLGYERGDTLTFGFNIRSNFNYLSQAKITPERVPAQDPKVSSIEEVSWPDVRQALRDHYSYAGTQFYVSENDSGSQRNALGTEDEAGSQRNALGTEADGAHTVTMYGSLWRHRDADQYLDRTARILAAELPASVERIEIVEQIYNRPMVKYELDLSEYRRQLNYEDPDVRPQDAWQGFTRTEPEAKPERSAEGWVEEYPEYGSRRPSYGWSPHLQQSFGSPETFYFYQVYLTTFANWQINENFSINGNVGINVHNNYDRFNFTVDGQPSPLPRARTFIREYMQQDVWLTRLQANYFTQLSNDWYALAYAGVLERMYSGVGGELLYRPLDSPWAVGADINRVRQRDFSGAFGLRDYEVTTGHVSVYYDMGRDFEFFKGSLLTLNFGQFLAGDRGVNVDFKRQFDSGMTVGAFAAFTNVSSEDYGEGSFTKGFYVSIPFDLMTIRPSRVRGTFGWSPIYRDGGHMLDRRMQLHPITHERSPFYDR